jgi:ribonuclease P protein component
LSRLFYRKSLRITSEKDFGRVLASKSVVRRGPMRLYTAPNELEIPRFGVSVSKSCGSAVERNKLKRRVREVFRTNQGQIKSGFDYILIISPKKAKIKEVQRSIKGLKTEYQELETQILDMVYLCFKQNLPS